MKKEKIIVRGILILAFPISSGWILAAGAFISSYAQLSAPRKKWEYAAGLGWRPMDRDFDLRDQYQNFTH